MNVDQEPSWHAVCVNKQQDYNYHDGSYIGTTQPMFIRTCQMAIRNFIDEMDFFITSHKPLKYINIFSLFGRPYRIVDYLLLAGLV